MGSVEVRTGNGKRVGSEYFTLTVDGSLMLNVGRRMKKV